MMFSLLLSTSHHRQRPRRADFDKNSYRLLASVSLPRILQALEPVGCANESHSGHETLTRRKNFFLLCFTVRA